MQTDESSPLAGLIEARRAALGLGEEAFLRAIGYRDIAKGRRRLAAFARAEGLRGVEHMVKPMARALEVAPDTVRRAVRETHAMAEAKAEAAYAARFVPHAVLRTERRVPTQIALAGITGMPARLILRFEAGTPPVSWMPQARAALPERLPFYGRVLGFWINYRPDHAVAFDREGNPLAIAGRAVRTGTVQARGAGPAVLA